jgi:hypothetical protein
MSQRKFKKKRKVATQNLDPAELAQVKSLERLRRQAASRLLKRRRRKSHQ